MHKALSVVSRVDPTDLMANRRALCHLQRKLACLSACHLESHEGDLQLRLKQSSLLVRRLRRAARIIRDHTDLSFPPFYKNTVVRSFVEATCTAAGEFMSRWAIDSPSMVPDSISERDAELDEKDLKCRLAFVFGGGPLGLDADDRVAEKWAMVKRRVGEMRDRLGRIEDGEVAWGRKVNGEDYKGRWRGQEVAGIQLMPEGESDPEVVAQVYSEVLGQAFLDPDRVVRIEGMTKSGMVVMELASCDLRTWCWRAHGQGESPVEIWQKLAVLLGAAKALRYVHGLGAAHGDVKSENFLVFDRRDSDPVVKLASMGVDRDGVKQDWATDRWRGPEDAAGQGLTTATDVFGFGLVMCEVVMLGESGMEGGGEGREPWALGEGLRRRLPEGMAELMARCCAGPQGERPSMGEVVEGLERLLAGRDKARAD
eukprot:evm.model.scf_2689.2 EVM.evm.TU.scf_2689.2   scf_2689:8822-10102(-)